MKVTPFRQELVIAFEAEEVSVLTQAILQLITLSGKKIVSLHPDVDRLVCELYYAICGPHSTANEQVTEDSAD